MIVIFFCNDKWY